MSHSVVEIYHSNQTMLICFDTWCLAVRCPETRMKELARWFKHLLYRVAAQGSREKGREGHDVRVLSSGDVNPHVILLESLVRCVTSGTIKLKCFSAGGSKSLYLYKPR